MGKLITSLEVDKISAFSVFRITKELDEKVIAFISKLIELKSLTFLLMCYLF
jgi:hypothetical protein